MPLLVVSGYPSSGKSTIVAKILEHLTSKQKKVVVVTDDECTTFSRSDYNDARKEKDLRSFVRSAVQKYLNKDTVVICDSLNYIKGYRYELFCVAKGCKTTYAVLQITPPEVVCEWLNTQKEEHQRYPAGKIADLLMRYEKPDPRNRWDSQLFEIKIGSAERSMPDISNNDDMGVDLEYPSPKYAEIPLDEIYQWLCEGKELSENLSTQSQPLAPTNFLHDLDRVTQDVVSTISEAQRSAAVGQNIVIPQAEAGSNELKIGKIRSVAELTRLRRQFISFSKTNPINDKAKIASLFVNFLNSTT
ncbi:hypothetical protein WR25_16100 [Diploscapter pachys]|uniref:Protein KTI12 homolog n=1 Tax=Diploscapter pachys TaxID=2018661 RepID=A0A2A2JX90_9BILA|nr:hypothetical protein WR25_16100 [Diploscapter pachys]